MSQLHLYFPIRSLTNESLSFFCSVKLLVSICPNTVPNRDCGHAPLEYRTLFVRSDSEIREQQQITMSKQMSYLNFLCRSSIVV